MNPSEESPGSGFGRTHCWFHSNTRPETFGFGCGWSWCWIWLEKLELSWTFGSSQSASAVSGFGVRKDGDGATLGNKWLIDLVLQGSFIPLPGCEETGLVVTRASSYGSPQAVWLPKREALVVDFVSGQADFGQGSYDVPHHGWGTTDEDLRTGKVSDISEESVAVDVALFAGPFILL